MSKRNAQTKKPAGFKTYTKLKRFISSHQLSESEQSFVRSMIAQYEARKFLTPRQRNAASRLIKSHVRDAGAGLYRQSNALAWQRKPKTDDYENGPVISISVEDYLAERQF